MEVWIGLVGVGPLPGSTTLGNAKGAYVNVLALALSEEEYRDAVKAALKELDLFPFEFEDVEPFQLRSSARALDQRLHDLAEEAQISGQVQFDSFHSYASLDS